MTLVGLLWLGSVTVRAEEPVSGAPASRATLASSLQADVGRASDDPDVICADLKTAPVQWGLVILGSEKDLASADVRAREISRKVGIPFSTEGYSLDPKTQRATYQRSSDGEYAPRTSSCEGSTECITIERSSAYAALAPRLFLIVGAVTPYEAPDSLAMYRQHVRDAYARVSALTGDQGGYGATSSCEEWDVLVLARTKLFSEADAIARAVSQTSGIPYGAKRTNPNPGEGERTRSAPFPNISVEADSAYGEQYDSTYFLVVGGELNYPESASLKLLRRYRKLVPNAYRMKRAAHLCGA
jgi:hypothetical protein